MPVPLSVKYNEISIRGTGEKEVAVICYVDFSSTSMEQMKLEPAHLEFIGSGLHVVRRGQALYHAHDHCTNIFVVRSGSFKSVVSNGRGLTQVTGFRMTGEVLGLGGLSTGRYVCDAIALEDSTVCDVPLEVLESACHKARFLQRHVHRLLSREIALEAYLMLLLGGMDTEARVAAFLVDLSNRFGWLGYSPTEFRLRMTRDDICSFLGMTRSTFMRGLSRLREKHLIATNGNVVRILNIEGLARI
jgi:CRP/FNR family transcriptional regulator, anaerobic regulatory protein